MQSVVDCIAEDPQCTIVIIPGENDMNENVKSNSSEKGQENAAEYCTGDGALLDMNGWLWKCNGSHKKCSSQQNFLPPTTATNSGDKRPPIKKSTVGSTYPRPISTGSKSYMAARPPICTCKGHSNTEESQVVENCISNSTNTFFSQPTDSSTEWMVNTEGKCCTCCEATNQMEQMLYSLFGEKLFDMDKLKIEIEKLKRQQKVSATKTCKELKCTGCQTELSQYHNSSNKNDTRDKNKTNVSSYGSGQPLKTRQQKNITCVSKTNESTKGITSSGCPTKYPSKNPSQYTSTYKNDYTGKNSSSSRSPLSKRQQKPVSKTDESTKKLKRQENTSSMLQTEKSTKPIKSLCGCLQYPSMSRNYYTYKNKTDNTNKNKNLCHCGYLELKRQQKASATKADEATKIRKNPAYSQYHSCSQSPGHQYTFTYKNDYEGKNSSSSGYLLSKRQQNAYATKADESTKMRKNPAYAQYHDISPARTGCSHTNDYYIDKNKNVSSFDYLELQRQQNARASKTDESTKKLKTQENALDTSTESINCPSNPQYHNTSSPDKRTYSSKSDSTDKIVSNCGYLQFWSAEDDGQDTMLSIKKYKQPGPKQCSCSACRKMAITKKYHSEQYKNEHTSNNECTMVQESKGESDNEEDICCCTIVINPMTKYYDKRKSPLANSKNELKVNGSKGKSDNKGGNILSRILIDPMEKEDKQKSATASLKNSTSKHETNDTTTVHESKGKSDNEETKFYDKRKSPAASLAHSRNELNVQESKGKSDNKGGNILSKTIIDPMEKDDKQKSATGSLKNATSKHNKSDITTVQESKGKSDTKGVNILSRTIIDPMEKDDKQKSATGSLKNATSKHNKSDITTVQESKGKSDTKGVNILSRTIIDPMEKDDKQKSATVSLKNSTSKHKTSDITTVHESKGKSDNEETKYYDERKSPAASLAHSRNELKVQESKGKCDYKGGNILSSTIIDPMEKDDKQKSATASLKNSTCEHKTNDTRTVQEINGKTDNKKHICCPPTVIYPMAKCYDKRKSATASLAYSRNELKMQGSMGKCDNKGSNVLPRIIFDAMVKDDNQNSASASFKNSKCIHKMNDTTTIQESKGKSEKDICCSTIVLYPPTNYCDKRYSPSVSLANSRNELKVQGSMGKSDNEGSNILPRTISSPMEKDDKQKSATASLKNSTSEHKTNDTTTDEMSNEKSDNVKKKKTFRIVD